MPLRISEPERSEAPRAGPGEREDGSREGVWEPRQSDLGNTPPKPETLFLVSPIDYRIHTLGSMDSQQREGQWKGISRKSWGR